MYIMDFTKQILTPEMIENMNDAELKIRDMNTMTLLHGASVQGNIEVVNSLINKGVSIYDFSCDNYLPIHYAAKNNHFDIIKRLFNEDNEIIHKVASYRDTPLHIAAESESIEAMICLIKLGSDIHATNFGLLTPLGVLCNQNDKYKVMINKIKRSLNNKDIIENLLNSFLCKDDKR